MAEKEIVDTMPAGENKKSFGAKLKERFRKFCVGLKRKPQLIPLLFLFVIAIYNLLTLYTYSEAVINGSKGVDWVGLLVFVNTLFSILILVAFLNTFPKLKKKGSKTVFTMTEKGIHLHINIIMLCVMLVMAAAMIACEAIYMNIETAHYNSFTQAEKDSIGISVSKTITFSLVHVILLGIFLALLFLLPLYRKLIMMIDTSVKLESATENMQEIDIQD